MQRLIRSGLSAAALLGLMTSAALPAIDIDLSVKGGDDALKERLKTASRLYAADETEDATAQDYAAAALAEYNTIVGVLYEEGYYGPTVSVQLDGQEATQLNPFRLPEQFSKARIKVETGPKFTFGRADIGPLPEGTVPPEGYAVGQDARLDVIRSAGQDAVDAWRNQGHAKAELTGQQITADHPARKLDVSLGLTPGPELKFGRLTVENNKNVREERIRAIAGLPRDQVYNPDDLAAAANRLRNTGAFRSVTMRESDEIRGGEYLDFAVNVVEAKPRRFGFGAELISDEGLTLSTFWMHRNILGGAEKLRFDAEVAGIGGTTGGEDLNLSARFERPATFDPRNTLFIQSTLERLDEPEYLSDQFRTDIGIVRQASDDLTVQYGLAFRRATIDDADGETSYSQLLFPVSATYDKRKGGASATGGYYLSGEVMPFWGLNDTPEGIRSTLDARTYVSAGDKTVFALRGQLGWIEGAKVEEVPADFQFYSGGGGTVRGQKYQSLGYGNGGGATFMGASLELRQGITDAISAVGFVDYGFIGAEAGWDTEGADHAGAGLGVRYDTPIGPLRLDLATPITGDNPGGALEIYIGIGQAF
ncbi:BamA/TamA family outer membrane protein [Donghicola sp. C2-DW-16]|uniref:BamA/TamA family outer membrane protein n=1 Tax=Donghicola mangrovi TaxID=2729614 RepID=A0ABX2PA13_9RHOB|nr:BamA/TamA family outer membrane protein [Donghicola mangrovi]NVO26208.1 BamA/TamA family outer membrane protein [Donghicola mangrovi]